MASDTVGYPVPEHPGQKAGPAGGPQLRRRPSGKLRWILAAALLLPVLELAVAIEVGTLIGPLATFGLIVLGAVIGMTVVRRQGSAAWRSLNASVRSGTPPSRELADATVLILAGVLFTVPGFVTDVAALLLVLPFTRPVARRPVEGWFRRAAADQASVRTAYIRNVQFNPGTGAAGQAGPTGPAGPGRFGPGFGRDNVIKGEVLDEDGKPGR